MKKPFLILFLVGFLLYLPSLFGPFLWDDEDFVYANKYVENFQIDKFFTDSQTAGRGKLSNYYRPVPQIIYASIHSITGFNPFWYHLVNILAHIGTAGAIFYFFYTLLEQTDSNETGRQQDKKFLESNMSVFAHAANRDLESTRTSRMSPKNYFGLQSLPFLAALIFLIHPVQTEAVSYISGLSDPLFVVFGFLSLIYFLKNRFLPSALFFLLSLLSKETGIVFLGLLLALELIKQKYNDRYQIVWSIFQTIKNSWGHIVIAMLYLWYHLTHINQLDMVSLWGNNIYSHSLTVRILTFVQSLYSYIGLLLFPKDLFMERDYSTHIQTNIFNPYLLGFILVNLLVIFAIWKLKHSLEIKNWKLKIAVFCFLGFFISFAPYSGIVLINGLFYEHFLYLPSVFFFAFWLILFQKFLGNKNVVIAIFLFLILLAGRNIIRQFDWTDAIRFYSQTLAHAPNSIRIQNGLAMAYADRGENDLAIRQYNNTISLNPNVPNLYHNLANVYAAMGEVKLAEENYLKAIDVDPKFLFSWQSLANLYEQTGQKEKLANLIERYKMLK